MINRNASRNGSRRALPVFAAALYLALAFVPAIFAHSDHPNDRNGIRHVLLISVDGMHAADYLNCSQGVKSINNGTPYCQHLAALGETGVNYTRTTTSRP